MTAAALKIMGKKISEKKDSARNSLKCVWVRYNDTHAIASDGHVIVCLDLNHYGIYSGANKFQVLKELAFYADMQALEYSNGFALITAEKKEKFVQEYPGNIENLELKEFTYPNWRACLPPIDAIKHSSCTGAVFVPGRLAVLDTVAAAFGTIPPGSNTLADKFYGADAEGPHIAICSGILFVAVPMKPNKEYIEIVPSKSAVQAFFRATPSEQTEMNFDNESDNESRDAERETEEN